MENEKGIPIRNIGNFTKNAVENFEQNIVDENNYLEKVHNELKQNRNTGVENKVNRQLF